MPAAIAPALGEGVVAGFSAYRYVYRKKFKQDTPLFAYFGYDRELTVSFRELPCYQPDTFASELLGDESLLTDLLPLRFKGDDLAAAEALLEQLSRSGDGLLTVQQLADKTLQPLARLQTVIDDLLREKQTTLPPITQKTEHRKSGQMTANQGAAARQRGRSS